MASSGGAAAQVKIALAILLFGIGLSKLVQWSVRPGISKSITQSNGTHEWSSTVILISLDGLKPEYLTSGYMPTLSELSQGHWPVESKVSRGILHAKSMKPVSPTLTFPNHWSLLTGLLPSSHGIIANDFHIADNNLSSRKQFYYTDPSRSWDSTWWKGVPIWEQLESLNIKTANLMWPGPPITSNDISSTYFQKYERGWTLKDRRKKIASWLDMDDEDRPKFICAYAPDVDSKTHSLGPNVSNDEVKSALRDVDAFILDTLKEVEARNASAMVNLIIVSDHGMTDTSNDRLIYLEDLLGNEIFSQLKSWDGWPNVGLRFDSIALRGEAASRLRSMAESGKGQYTIADRIQLIETWKWELTPLIEERVAELWILPKVGWSVTTRREMEEKSQDYRPRGNHGYHADNEEMKAFFLALGPFIRSSITDKLASFSNLEIHNLVMSLMNISLDNRAKTNGTLHFWDRYLTVDS